MDLAARIVNMVAADAAIRSIALVGSRADGTATAFSDWDFRVEAHEFEAASEALPRLLAPLDPLVQQWDRLSPEWCWMLIVRGPTKIDLIFPGEPHTNEPPWIPAPENLDAIEGHFWDWMLWLRGKEARGKAELIAGELEKLSDHLLTPLGVSRTPSSISEAIEIYRQARNRAERRFAVSVRHDLEEAVAPAFESSKGPT